MNSTITGKQPRKGVIVLGLLLLLAGTALGQDSRTLDLGTMSYFTRENLNGDQVDYPRGVNEVDTDLLDSYGVSVGVVRNWTSPSGETFDVQVAQVMHNKFSDTEQNTVPVSGAFKRVFRNKPPAKVLDGTNWTPSFNVTDPVDPNLPADGLIYAKLDLWPNYGMGMTLERWTYAFADDDYDDFVIHEYRITNTSSEARNGVYFAVHGGLHSAGHYPGDLWGNYYGVTYPKFVEGDASADSMRVYYAWRANNREVTGDDKGDPDSQWGNFQEAQFISRIVLHADKSASDESDDPLQPQKAGWSQRDYVAQLSEGSHATVYQFLSGPWNTGDNAYDRYVDRDGNTVAPPPTGGAKFRILDNPAGQPAPAWVESNDWDSQIEQEKNNLMSFGPYDLGPGEDVRVVTAMTAGMIPSRLAIDAGRAYDSGPGARQTFGVCKLYQPESGVCSNMPNSLTYNDMLGRPIVVNGNVVDPSGNVVAQKGQVLDKVTKNAVIDLGLDMSLKIASRARQLWMDSDVKYGAGSFADYAFAPAAPSIEGTSENDQIRLKWTSNQGDSRGGPIAGWKVYREYKRPPAVTAPTDTTFLELTTLPAGTTEYIDTDVVRGEDYYYYVAATNDAGLESGSFQNRTGTSTTKSDEALSATRGSDANWKDNVVIVPNPFHIQGAEKYSGRRLNFLNLPAYANIHIYTITGERVQTISHVSNTGDEDWERQDTFSTTEIVSGVYLAVIEELDASGSPTGESTIKKFVVIK